MKKNSICVIGVYFGSFPKYFDLWLKSASYNPQIDFKIFTDSEIENYPNNVNVIHMTLQEMKTLAEQKLKMQVSLEKPYRCCDFKVVYGVIFQEYIGEYEYWGHCDFDLIWGDIYTFLTTYDYQKYDRFLDLGHFSLYRNTPTVNNYYKKDGSLCGDYAEVFSQDRNFAFDEHNGLDGIYRKHNYPAFRKRIFADISSIYKRYRLALKDINYDYQVFYWDNGHVYRDYIKDNQVKTEEFIYIHFKKRPNYDSNDEVRDSSSFYVTNRGFFKRNRAQNTKECIQQMNPYRGKLYETIELINFKCLAYKNRILRNLAIRK